MGWIKKPRDTGWRDVSAGLLYGTPTPADFGQEVA